MIAAEDIARSLTGLEHYNPDHRPKLEAYVEQQCATGAYDLNANLAVLKLYQFNPSSFNADITIKILLKALTQLPSNDFSFCLFLLTDEVMKIEAIDAILQMHELLETAEFAQFWELYEKQKDAALSIQNFLPAIRKFITTTIGITYQSISVAEMSKYLGLDGEQLSEYLKGILWRQENGVISVPLSSENVQKPHIIQQNIKFEQLTKILGHCD